MSSQQRPPRITALRERRKDVEVELDGVPWRAVPVDAVVRAGLAVGRELDRPLARELARELRRSRALAVAGRALRARDHTRRSLEERLAQRSVPATARRDAVETLAAAGAVDDGRFALGRAESLARRGWGDAAILADLERQGVEGTAAAAALAALEPESERARALVARRGRGAGTARFLASRGFDADLAAEAALGVVAADD